MMEMDGEAESKSTDPKGYFHDPPGEEESIVSRPASHGGWVVCPKKDLDAELLADLRKIANPAKAGSKSSKKGKEGSSGSPSSSKCRKLGLEQAATLPVKGADKGVQDIHFSKEFEDKVLAALTKQLEIFRNQGLRHIILNVYPEARLGTRFLAQAYKALLMQDVYLDAFDVVVFACFKSPKLVGLDGSSSNIDSAAGEGKLTFSAEVSKDFQVLTSVFEDRNFVREVQLSEEWFPKGEE